MSVYDSAFDPRLSQEALARGQEDRRAADALLNHLFSLSPREQVLAVLSAPYRSAAALPHLLLARARKAPPEQRKPVLLLLLTATRGQRRSAEVRAAAHCELASLLLQEQGNGLTEAGRHLRLAERGIRNSADPSERARFCHVLATLRRAQGLLDESMALFRRASELYADAGDHQALLQSLIEFASLAFEHGELDRALPAFALAVRRAPGDEIAFKAGEGLVRCLALQGRHEYAAIVLKRLSSTFAWTPSMLPVARLKVRIGLSALVSEAPDVAAKQLHEAFQVLATHADCHHEALCAGVDAARATLRARRSLQPELSEPLLRLLRDAGVLLPKNGARDLATLLAKNLESALVLPFTGDPETNGPGALLILLEALARLLPSPAVNPFS